MNEPSLYPWPVLRGVTAEPGSLVQPGDACASCRLPVAPSDAAFTDGGQRLHRDGCPIDDEPRPLRKRRELEAHGFAAEAP